MLQLQCDQIGLQLKCLMPKNNSDRYFYRTFHFQFHFKFNPKIWFWISSKFASLEKYKNLFPGGKERVGLVTLERFDGWHHGVCVSIRDIMRERERESGGRERRRLPLVLSLTAYAEMIRATTSWLKNLTFTILESYLQPASSLRRFA